MVFGQRLALFVEKILLFFSMIFRIDFASEFCMRFLQKSEAKPPPRGEGPAAGGDGRGLSKSEKTMPGGAGASTGCIFHYLRSCAPAREINIVNLLYNNCKSYEVTEQVFYIIVKVTFK